MTNWTGIAAVIAPITTLLGVLGGYWLAGHNEEERDRRAATREGQARIDAFAEKLEEDRHSFQRLTLLELQDELQRMVRNTAQAIMQDQETIKEQGQIFLQPLGLSEEANQITVSLQRLRARVLDDELRAAIGDFIGRCSVAGIGLLGYPRGLVPEDQREAAHDRLERMMTEMGQEYLRLTDLLGSHLRRELDRWHLLSGRPRTEP
jgi:hypothetical protein